jgi:phosphoglycolate phosphatase
LLISQPQVQHAKRPRDKVKITTILCDLDGTLVDSRQDIAIAFQHAWRTTIGGSPPSATTIARHIGKPLAEMVIELGGMLSPSLLSTFLISYRWMFAKQGASMTHPYPDVISTLLSLSRFQLAILTTKESGQAEIVLRKLALTSLFQHVQGSSRDMLPKPAPASVMAALAELHCAPSQALIVGDTPADVLAGKAAGTRTCAVTYGFSTTETLLRCAPDHMIDSFGELVNLMRELQ